MIRVIPLLAGVLLAPACFPGTSAELTDSGKGFPQVNVEFPPVVEVGSVQEAIVEVGNPGPADMGSVVISFGLLGAATLPAPLVAPAAPDGPTSVIDVEPEPVRVSNDRVVYEFSGLEEGESVTIVFELRMPREPGEAGNSVVASEGADPERARGDRLLTDVQR